MMASSIFFDLAWNFWMNLLESSCSIAYSVFSMMFSHIKFEMLSAIASWFSGKVCLSWMAIYAFRTALGYFRHY